MNCARWDLCGGYWVTDIPTAILVTNLLLTRSHLIDGSGQTPVCCAAPFNVSFL